MNAPITDIELKMVGEDGDAYAIISRGRQALRKNGRTDLIDAFTKECTSSDYAHLIATCAKYFIVL